MLHYRKQCTSCQDFTRARYEDSSCAGDLYILQPQIMDSITSIINIDSAAPDCRQVSADRMTLYGTQDEKDMYADLANDYRAGNILTFEDLKLVYAPSCKRGSHETDEFAELQCFIPVDFWPAELPRYFCWCANSITGYPINDTITEGLIYECCKSAAQAACPQ